MDIPCASAKRSRSSSVRACTNCAKSKKKCDGERPCGRCVRLGSCNSCEDRQTKRQSRISAESKPQQVISARSNLPIRLNLRTVAEPAEMSMLDASTRRELNARRAPTVCISFQEQPHGLKPSTVFMNSAAVYAFGCSQALVSTMMESGKGPLCDHPQSVPQISQVLVDLLGQNPSNQAASSRSVQVHVLRAKQRGSGHSAGSPSSGIYCSFAAAVQTQNEATRASGSPSFRSMSSGISFTEPRIGASIGASYAPASDEELRHVVDLYVPKSLSSPVLSASAAAMQMERARDRLHRTVEYFEVFQTTVTTTVYRRANGSVYLMSAEYSPFEYTGSTLDLHTVLESPATGEQLISILAHREWERQEGPCFADQAWSTHDEVHQHSRMAPTLRPFPLAFSSAPDKRATQGVSAAGPFGELPDVVHLPIAPTELPGITTPRDDCPVTDMIDNLLSCAEDEGAGMFEAPWASVSYDDDMRKPVVEDPELDMLQAPDVCWP